MTFKWMTVILFKDAPHILFRRDVLIGLKTGCQLYCDLRWSDNGELNILSSHNMPGSNSTTLIDGKRRWPGNEPHLKSIRFGVQGRTDASYPLLHKN